MIKAAATIFILIITFIFAIGTVADNNKEDKRVFATIVGFGMMALSIIATLN